MTICKKCNKIINNMRRHKRKCNGDKALRTSEGKIHYADYKLEQKRKREEARPLKRGPSISEEQA